MTRQKSARGATAPPEFTEDDMLAELARLYGLPEREPGWLDAGQVAKALNCSVSTVPRRMQALVASGGWLAGRVRGPNGKGQRVWRKAA